jgi:hypothetical protein
MKDSKQSFKDLVKKMDSLEETPLSEMSLFMNKFLVCAARMSLTSRRFK